MYYRGHHIWFIFERWVYVDTGDSVENNHRSCGHCGEADTIKGHDGCLGTLRGIRNACCGHGQIDSAYVQFQDMYSIHGKPARVIIERLLR